MALEIKGLEVSFDRPVLQGIELTWKKGAVVGVVGASGGGKSSLMKVIAGLLDANAGEVRWNRKRVKGPAEKLIPGHEQIQLVNQDFQLDLYHSVRENIRQKMLYLPVDIRESFIIELLELVDLEEQSEQQALTLSGGEQQRLAIARALATEPEVILLDEPFSHLDAHLKQRIGDYLRLLVKRRKMLCVLVSHEGQDVLEWCDEIVFLDKGKVKRTGTPIDFYYKPESAYEARFFGEINSLGPKRSPILFRPNQFEINPTGTWDGVVVNSRFAGSYWRNRVCVKKNEYLVLFSQEPLSKEIRFDIKRKDTETQVG